MNKWLALPILTFSLVGSSCSPPAEPPVTISGEALVWHPLVFSVRGPESFEGGTPNPFLDYRLTVTFSSGEASYVVPGYFAADGNAADTSADSGSVWRVFFVPDRAGVWNYRVSFLQAEGIAIRPEDPEGQSVAPDGESGQFEVAESGTDPDPRNRGFLRYVGERYLRYAGSGMPFLKSGADSPENFLAYADFDGDWKTAEQVGLARQGEAALAPRHKYEPHVGDWRPGDPTWKGDKGKGMIGALNYLAARGVNSVYFLTMNIAGDGNDIWPYRTRDDRFRFDCSKLDQWNRVFDHMDQLGIQLHVVLTETENESLFEVEEGREFADRRKLYYRELVARFAHHTALVWNIGEENGWDNDGWEEQPQTKGNTDEQRKAFADYLRELDPYDHPIVVHTLPGRYEEIYQPLLGHASFEGPSLQISPARGTHAETIQWLDRSEAAGRPWFVCLDEIGPAEMGVKPDADDPGHDEVRRYALWGNLMAGGSGCEWYFGYQFPHNDLNLEDFRSREKMWDQTRIAVEFFHQHLPFPEMRHADSLISGSEGYCLAREGEVYALYLPGGENAGIELPDGSYSIAWFNPRTGGPLRTGTVAELSGGGVKSPGSPPEDTDKDWVALIQATPGG